MGQNPLKEHFLTRIYKPSAEERFRVNKNEIRIPSVNYPQENVEKICTLDEIDRTRLICWTDVLENSEYWYFFIVI